MQGLPGVPSYTELKSGATTAELLGVEVAVCSLADLEDLDLAHEEKQ